MPNYSLEELQDIVERQRKIYGDALDRVFIELQKRNIDDLADYVQAIKILYGMGDFRTKVTIKKVRGEIRSEEAELEIVDFLRARKGERFHSGTIIRNLSGILSDRTWRITKQSLIRKKQIRTEGTGKGQFYWID